MDLKPYVANIKAFVGSLPTSEIAFLYFQKSQDDDKKFIPRVNTSAKEWVLNKDSLYIIQSSDAYCYVYKESAIKYKIHLDKGAVSAFEPEHSTYGLVSGGSGAVVNNANWGNHLTVGLMKSFMTKNILLVTHTTTYVPNPDNPVEYHKEPSIPCNVYLKSNLDESCDCISNGKPSGLHLDLYNKYDTTVIPIIKTIHRYIWNGVPKGGRKLRARKQPNILIGPKGGKYRLIKGRRVYIGGNGDFKDPSGGFVPSFVAFIKEVALNIVASYRSELYEAFVVDDGSDHVLLRYCFRGMGYDMSHIFMMERGIVTNGWRAYEKPPEERTEVETNALDTFVAVVDGFRNVISVEA